MNYLILRWVSLLGLLGASLPLSGFGAEPSKQWLQGLWTGEDTNRARSSVLISIKLNTNGQGAVRIAGNKLGFLGTFTYTLSEDQVMCFTNGSPHLTGTLHYDAATDSMRYYENADVAAALKIKQGPVLLTRDTNRLHNAMLGAVIGATNFVDVMTRSIRFSNTNNVETLERLKKAQPNGAANGSQPISSATN